jgi:large subunit ribosomal protein L15
MAGNKSFKLNTIRDNAGALKVRKVVGRGIGSGLGKTSGRGGKGQTARSGVSLNGFEGGQMPIYRRLPRRGFKNPGALRLFELHFRKLYSLISQSKLAKGQTVDAAFLISNGLMAKSYDGISLIAQGELEFPLNFSVIRASKKAVELVEKVGGSVTMISRR